MAGPSSAPEICSGAAQRGEKSATVLTGLSDGSITLARRTRTDAIPKSASFGISACPTWFRPLFSVAPTTRANRMFDGLMSRCKIPCSCASATAPQIRSRTEMVSLAESRPNVRTCVSRFPPSRNSEIWKGRSSSV